MVAEETIVEKVPLLMDKDGAIRVSGTRVLLDLIVGAYWDGESAEHIAESYPVPVADVYHVIGYYLRHRKELDCYIEKRRLEAEELRKVIEARWPPDGIKARLLARRAVKQ